MLKNIMNLQGTHKLTRNEQKSINGGRLACDSMHLCPKGQCCVKGTCWLCIE